MASIVEQYIRQRAPIYGIDPNVATRVAGAEAMNVFDPTQPDRGGDGGSSFGPFQLHYGGVNPSMPHPGLGDDFTAATGLNARDPSTWKQQVDFSLAHAAQGGWSPWMGAKAAGVAPFQGIGSPSPYAGFADGPKGQETYALPGAWVPGSGSAVASDGGDGSNLNMTGQQGKDIASILNPQQQNNLQTMFQKLAQTPNAPAPYLRGIGDARSTGNSLLNALRAPTLSDLLIQKRLVG